MNDQDMIQRNQVAMMSGIAALLERTRVPELRKLADDLGGFALETASYLQAKLNGTAFPTMHDAAERAWTDAETKETPS